MRVALVVWDGLIGGAERLSVSLAGEFRRRGVDATVVFVGAEDQLRSQLAAEGVPSVHLEFRRGAEVLRHPRHFARAIATIEADVAILSSFGFLGTALRAGGYRGAIIGVEHGALATLTYSASNLRGRLARLKLKIDRATGLPAYDAEVAVSSFMEALALKSPLRCRRLVRIANGIALPAPSPLLPDSGARPLRVGYAGRLVPGKGVDVAIRACALLAHNGVPVTLHIAGDGPDRDRLSELAIGLRISHIATFEGWVSDIHGFWANCDLAVAPNDTLAESFCLAATEAMAAGRPVVVSDIGALPELILGGTGGILVAPGDVTSLAQAIGTYASDRERLAVDGAAARTQVESRYSLPRCADAYLALANSLIASPGKS